MNNEKRMQANKHAGHISVLAFNKVFNDLIDRELIKNKSELATLLGTYNHVINAILQGKRKPTLDQVGRLVTLFDIDANAFFKGIETPLIHNTETVSGLKDHENNIKRKTIAKFIGFLGDELKKLNDNE